MADYTENYNLKKPDRTDFYSVQDFNDNADIIDAALDDKLNKDFSNISSGAGGAVPIANGGTGATTAAQALINLGVESNYKLLGVNGLLANQDVLSYVDSLEEPKCGFFWTNGCTNTPNDGWDWWYMNLTINSDRQNEGQKTLWAQIRANGVCEVWVNQKWFVNGSFTWCGWCKIPRYGERGEFMALELSTTTPFIDFHYNSSTEDYTARIIQTGLNVLQFSNTYPYANGTLDVKVNGYTITTTANSSTSGVTYVTSSTPSYARNNDLWAW